ncbi:MAG TPA: TlpA disulfide reductase family protein [Pyrinomonadaceae bacterium]|nr:TlpA disulfide reductase family protein [Pyrinomonadaceae bacterium]
MINIKKLQSGFLTPGRLSLTVLVLGLIALVGSSSCNSTDEFSRTETTNPKPPATSVRVKPAAPAALTALPPHVLDAELTALKGDPIKLSNYSGKVLVVNLWATWCGPCRIEIPELVQLHKEFRSQGLEVVGLSTENPERSAELVREFVRQHKVNYRIGWATPEVALTLMQGRDAIPQSLVIGRDGRILKRFVGFSATSTPRQLRQAIEDALKEKETA